MTTNIVTPQAVKSANAVCTAAKTTYGDGTNAQLLLTASASGAVLYGLTAIARGTMAADNKAMLFRSRDGGTTLFFVRAAIVPAYATDLGTTKQTPIDFGYTDTNTLRLGANERLYVGCYTAAANGVVFDANYEDMV